MDQLAFIMRMVAYAAAFLTVLFLSAQDTVLLFIYMGQAHFILAYWYRFERVPSLVRSPIFLLWVACSVGLLALALLDVLPLEYLIAIAAILFVTHFIVDEITLSVKVLPLPQALALFGGLACLFILEIAGLVFGIQYGQTFLLLVALSTLLGTIMGLWFYTEKIINSYFTVYALIVGGISSVMLILVEILPLGYSLGFIILSHYLIWYFHYYLKLKGIKPALKTYCLRVVGVNGLMLLIFIGATFGHTVPLHRYFFSDYYFYIWTCVHIIISFVPKQFSGFFWRKQIF